MRTDIIEDVAKTVAILDHPDEDTQRELAFAISAADANDAASLRWLAACAIKRAEDISA